MITVTISNPQDLLTYSFSPMAISIPMGELNENLQHVAQTCQLTAAYEPKILEIMALRSNVPATVEDETGILFTGIIDTGVTWTDNGSPTPIDALQLKINDNTYLLDTQSTDEVALIDTTLAAVIERICQDCAVTIPAYTQLPDTPLKAFIMDAGTNYLQALNNLLFQHEQAFIFNGAGELVLVDFSTPPAKIETLGEDKILTGLSPTRTAKKYGAVKIGYTTITKRADQQVYFEGNGLGSDNKIIPITIRPGQYYPYESDPVQEAREGQVYQDFANGYAESYQAYNGEKKYRRSEKTSLLCTENQRLVQDWQGYIGVDRTDFQARRSSVRLKNTGTQDANLMQLAIRADAWYREPTSYVTSGTGSEYVYEGEYLYTAEAAEKLSKTLSRFFLGGNFKISGRIAQPVAIGQFLHIDTGVSGFTANALCLSCSFEPESEIYTASFITYGDVAIDINRYKTQVGRGDANSQILSTLMNGTGIGAPDAPVIESVTAEQNGINITITPPVGNINNLSVRYTVELTKNSGTTTIESTSLSAVYTFDRKVDGYPEASDLSSWRVRVKAVNVYGKESPWSDEAAIDTSSYGTWTLQSPLVDVGVMDRTVTLQFGQPPRGDMRQLYGTTQYCLQVQRPDLDDKWYKPNTSDNPYADETNFRSEEGGLLVVQNSFYAQTMPLSGQDTSQITDTLYRFRIFCRNEAYISRGEDGPAVEVNATALCTNIRDIVKAKETAKEAYISNLSAISANIGRISQGGLGDDLNFWNLSTFTDDLGNTYHKGSFRVGNHKNYIEVVPILEDGRVVDYKVVIQASSINVDANLSQFTTTIYLYDHDDDTIRMVLSSTGMKLQRRADGDIWQDLSVMQIDRLHNLIVSTRQVGSVNSVQLPADTLSHCVPLDYSKRMFTIGNQGFEESILTEGVYPLLDGGYTGGPTPVRQSSFCGKAVVGVLAPVAFFSDASDIEFGRNRQRIIESGKGDLANLFNANASTAWGLTQTQVDAGLAVAREDT